MADCREKIIRELEGKLTIGEIEAVFSKIERRFFPYGDRPKELATEGDVKAYEDKLASMTNDQRWQEAAKKAFQDAVHEKKEQLRRSYLQAERTNFIIEYMKKNNKESGGHVNTLIRLLVGDIKGAHDTLTLEATKNGILKLDMADMFKSMDDYMNFFGFKMTDEQALNIIREIDNRGTTGDKAAQKLADAWEKWADRSRDRKNDLGADVGFLKDWRMPQIWDAWETKKYGLTGAERRQLLNPFASTAEREAVYLKARQNFIDEAIQRVDRERYKDYAGNMLNDEDIRTALNTIFDTITTRGLNQAPDAAGGPIGPKKSLAQKLGEHRELHFKSAEDWYYFNKNMGESDILGIMRKAIIANARDTALLEVFGPNPDQAFKTLLAWAEHLDRSKKGSVRAQAYFDEIKGVSKIPMTERGEIFANAMLGIRHWTVATKLGSLLLSQVNDIATYTAIARADGLGLGKAIEFAAKELAHAGDKRTAMQLGIASQHIINDVGMRYGEGVKGVDFSSKAANMTIKLSGAEYWTEAIKRSFEMLVGFELRNAVKDGLDKMPVQFKSMLKRYGIADAEWQIIQKSRAAAISGQEMITPMQIKRMADDIELMGGDKTEAQAIRNTAIKVAAMMGEEADIAVVSPGARELALLKNYTLPGTLSGEIMRSFALFKTFSVSLTTKVLPRVFAVEGTGTFRAGLAAQFALGMIVAGGISYQLKQIAFGRNPRDITTPEFWLAAAAQSGGLGIFGDYLFADYNRFGGDIMSSVGGPIGGLASDFAKLTIGNARDALMGKDTHFAAEAFQFVKNQTPLINLWYTRAALDHLLFFHVQEAANPGYLRRMRSRAQRENNQTFWWDPQDTLPEETPDLGYMFGGSR